MISDSHLSSDLLDRIAETRSRATIHELINFDGEANTPPRVSVIVPVCNVEEFLPECLDSILAQTQAEFEVICINDGSSDNSLQILKDYAHRDHRVKVIDKDNAGYGHAMNIGMDFASGEFIAIVESDDYIRPAMLERLSAVASDFELDFVKSDFYRFTTEPLATRLFYNALTPKKDLYNVVLSPLDDSALFKFTNTWTGLYRRSFLYSFGIRHQETPGASYQDNGFWFQTTCAARRFMYLEEPFYMNRRDNPNSSVFNDKKLYAGNSEFAFVGKFLDRHPELRDSYASMLVKKKFDNYIYNYTRVSPQLKEEYIRACSHEFAQAYANGEVDPTLYSASDATRLAQIATDPLGFHESHKHSRLGTFSGEVAKGSIPVVFIADEAYAMPAGVAISSLLHHRNKGTKYHITVVGVGLSDSTIKKFASFNSAGTAIETISVNTDRVSELSSSEITSYGVPSIALLKFLLPSLLPNQDRVLYLDDDIIVRGDLSDLYRTDLGGRVAGVVADVPQVLYEKQVFGSEYGRGYFNSGVMLLNLAKMRRDGYEAALIRSKSSIQSRLMDQDVFNHVFRDDVVSVPIRFNTLMVNLVRSTGRYSLTDINDRYGTNYRTLEDVRRDSVILHFCSKDKPWKFYDVPMADEWMTWLMRSPFGEVRLLRSSVREKGEETVSNGLYDLAPPVHRETLNVAVWASDSSTPVVRRLLRSLAHQSVEEDLSVSVHIFFRSLGSVARSELEALAGGRVETSFWDLSRVLERDEMYVRGGELPRGYFKLVVAEVLAHCQRVLILDGASLVGRLTEVLCEVGPDEEIAISPVDGGSLRLFDAGAIVLDVEAFLKLRVKMRFFEEFGTLGEGRRTYRDAVSQAMKGMRVVALDSPQLDLESHNRGVFKEDIKSLVSSAPRSRQAPVRNSVDQAGRQPSATQQRTYEDGVTRVRSSPTYRVGRVFTLIPGVIKRSLRRGRNSVK